MRNYIYDHHGILSKNCSEYISRTFALQLANRVSWFCCCVWSENVFKKKWHVPCVCWCGWRLRRTGGSLWDLLVPHRPGMCVCEYIVNHVSWFCCCVWSENVFKKIVYFSKRRFKA